MSVSISAFSPVLGSDLPVSTLAPISAWRYAFVRLSGGGWGLVAGVPTRSVAGVSERLKALGCSNIKVLSGERLSSVRFRGPTSAVVTLAEYLPVACAVR